MILIVTYKEDYTADFLINKLNEQGRKFVRLNTEDIEKCQYVSHTNTNFSFQLNGITSFDGVWFRRLKLPDINADEEIVDYLATEYEYLFSNLLRNINARNWLSSPDSIGRAENKVVQLRTAQSLGFLLPDTLITNDKKNVRTFAKKHEKSGIVVKPLYSGRIETTSELRIIFTSEVDSNHLHAIDNYDLTPCIFQENIHKAYELRVTVVGSKVFAARVNSQDHENTKIDWRKERLDFTCYNLPDEISGLCRALVKSMQLNFGAIDLIKSVDNNYYFLEINPNGQWAWIEMDTGMPISQSIIDFLYDGK